MLQFKTERLTLRNYRAEDLNDVHEYFSNETVAEYEDFYPMARDGTAELIDEWKNKDNRLAAA